MNTPLPIARPRKKPEVVEDTPRASKRILPEVQAAAIYADAKTQRKPAEIKTKRFDTSA